MRARTRSGGELERAVLEVVWDMGRASARDVHERVGLPSALVYTTTAKVLDRLHAKGMLVRERQGKAFVYRAAVARSTVHRAETAVSLRRLLGTSPKPGIAVLVETMEAIDPALLDELARAVAERKARP